MVLLVLALVVLIVCGAVGWYAMRPQHHAEAPSRGSVDTLRDAVDDPGRD